MLFRQALWPGLRDGSITLAVRRWRTLSVKPGGRYRTRIGVLEVDSVELCDLADITEDDARRAGAPSRGALVAELASFEGQVYRINLHYAGPDPRIQLRQEADLPGEAWARLSARLDRLDRASPRGPWTRQILRLIEARPETAAVELAQSMGRDRASFKIDVRKLKELGLTESLNPGYRLSPRGRAFLAQENTPEPDIGSQP